MKGMVFMGNASVWSKTAAREIRSPLEGNISTDVLIVGGGMNTTLLWGICAV
jgi:hypothetical protein